jgi:hypothetical protein
MIQDKESAHADLLYAGKSVSSFETLGQGSNRANISAIS